MGLLGDITGLGTVATAASEATKSITDLLKSFIPDPNKRIEAEVQLQQILAERDKALYEGMSQVMVADSNSDSAYTRNARPTVVYWSLAMITAITGSGVFGVAEPIIAALTKVPGELYGLVGTCVGAFTIGRSVEKAGPSIAEAITKVLARK